ncbi:hypothetical protein JYU34_019717 [Plutella xylostella]|uniref:Uncharacterized protein n=1 Tax=Plutella xylostella TaxID=51655 RepID=A0ABQ7PV57_PLUXY|nr:hypothetical protein JYU34_019717 [Plutella xylostella]
MAKAKQYENRIRIRIIDMSMMNKMRSRLTSQKSPIRCEESEAETAASRGVEMSLVIVRPVVCIVRAPIPISITRVQRPPPAIGDLPPADNQ